MAKRKSDDASNKSILTRIHRLIREAGKQYDCKPCDVTSTQFWTVADGKVDEWEVRKLGGFTNIRGLEFPPPPERSEARNAVIPRSATPSKAARYRAPRLENFTAHETSMHAVFSAAKLKPDDVLRVVVQPDTHVPEHDPIAINAFLKFLSFYKPHGFINLGDFMEMGSVSHWDPKDAKPRRLVPEVKAAKELLRRIDRALGPQCVYKRFLMGNHEDWLDQYLVGRMPEVYDGLDDIGVDMRVQGLLGLKDLGYRVIPINEVLRLGELHYIHGYYTNIHHAKKHLEVFGCNLMYGHLHDVQSHSAVSIKGVREAMSIGCLRLLNAPFMKGRPNNWSHAFGVIEYRYDGSYTRYVPLLVDGKFSFNGKVFDGHGATAFA